MCFICAEREYVSHLALRASVAQVEAQQPLRRASAGAPAACSRDGARLVLAVAVRDHAKRDERHELAVHKGGA